MTDYLAFFRLANAKAIQGLSCDFLAFRLPGSEGSRGKRAPYGTLFALETGSNVRGSFWKKASSKM